MLRVEMDGRKFWGEPLALADEEEVSFSGNEDVVTWNPPEQSVGALSNNLPRELDNDHIQGWFLFDVGCRDPPSSSVTAISHIIHENVFVLSTRWGTRWVNIKKRRNPRDLHLIKFTMVCHTNGCYCSRLFKYVALFCHRISYRSALRGRQALSWGSGGGGLHWIMMRCQMVFVRQTFSCWSGSCPVQHHQPVTTNW